MKIIKTFKKLRYWQFLLLLLISLPITAYLLRQNNLRMVELTKAVVAIDEESSGDIEQIEPSLEELRDFVGSHMNTTMLAPVQLQYRYNAVVDELVNVQEKTDTEYRRKVYKKAQIKCQAVLQSIRVPCIQDYVASQPGVDPINVPPVELFSYEFGSPDWSPDLAGFSVLASGMLGFFTVLYFVNDVAIPAVIGMVRKDPLE